jgi:transposase InsO family protein
MGLRLHKNARTTPAVRSEIAASTEGVSALARRYGVGRVTVRKWKQRADTMDRSHTAHHLQTTMNSAQEAIAVYLRQPFLLSLDDLVAVVREFLCPEVSRSGMDRCLSRHGVGNLRDLLPKEAKSPAKGFNSYEPGFLHMDVKYLPQMEEETKRRYLFVAIDRATRWVYLEVKEDKTAKSARAFLQNLSLACPIRIQKILTDNGKEFTDRLFSRDKQASGRHEFDQLCAALEIEHRLTRPRMPQTNGMVERFNGRIADILKTHHFRSGEDLERTLLRYAMLYNEHLPQAAIDGKTPLDAMNMWYASHPQCFKRLHGSNRTGCDTRFVLED